MHKRADGNICREFKTRTEKAKREGKTSTAAVPSEVAKPEWTNYAALAKTKNKTNHRRITCLVWHFDNLNKCKLEFMVSSTFLQQEYLVMRGD